MSMLDIFRGDAFSVVSLTDAINKPVFQPGRIGGLGLFTEVGVATIDIAIAEKDGILTLVPPTPRGGPGTTLPKLYAKIRPVRVPHFQIDDGVMAEEVQGVRAWDSDSQVEVFMDKVSERMMLHRASHEVTLEFSRFGALTGIVTYADGSNFNLFTFFEITPPAEIDFALATTVNGDLRKKCAGVIRQMTVALGGIPFTSLYAFCGDNFFDALIANAEIRATYLNNPMAAELRRSYISNGMSYGSFEFGGITWENYRGYVGSQAFIDPDKCYIFPIGVPNLFKTYFGPADYIETVNRTGQRMYVKQYPMPNDKGIYMEVQTNPLNVCTRPNALLKGHK